MERTEPPDEDERARQIAAVLSEFDAHVSSITGGDHQSGVLLVDSIRTYRDGTFAASLVCGHASCERELAGWG